MFQKGDLIIYNNEGVCRVENIGPLESISDNRGERLFYKLSPLYGKGFIFIPVDTKIFMRPVITKDEAQLLISKIPNIKSGDADAVSQKELAEYYQSSFRSHECEDLLQLIKTVYLKSQRQSQLGKKPGQTDQRYMKRAEELLHGELAVALDIPVEDVPKYIERELAGLAANAEVG